MNLILATITILFIVACVLTGILNSCKENGVASTVITALIFLGFVGWLVFMLCIGVAVINGASTTSAISMEIIACLWPVVMAGGLRYSKR